MHESYSITSVVNCTYLVPIVNCPYLVERYVGLAEVLLKNPSICALCYTQLYDVEQEQNGIYFYDRTPKFSNEIMTKLKLAMEQKAAIES